MVTPPALHTERRLATAIVSSLVCAGSKSKEAAAFLRGVAATRGSRAEVGADEKIEFKVVKLGNKHCRYEPDLR